MADTKIEWLVPTDHPGMERSVLYQNSEWPNDLKVREFPK